MTTRTIAGAGPISQFNLTDKIPVSQAGAAGYGTPSQLKAALITSQNIDNVARIGIGTTDSGNVLSVSGATSLFANSGDCRVSMSKGAVGNTTAFNFQDNFSTRVQFGLLGNDSFTISCSPDGSTFNNALVSTTAGAVSVPTGSLTLGAQQTTQGSLVLGNTAAGAYATTLASSNSATAAYTLTLPPAPPAVNGYVLSATTAGIGSWVASSSGTITIGTTPTSGATAGQILYSDGSNIQAGGGTLVGNALALGGATIGTNALAVTGTSTLSSSLTVSAGQIIAPYNGGLTVPVFTSTTDTTTGISPRNNELDIITGGTRGAYFNGGGVFSNPSLFLSGGIALGAGDGNGGNVVRMQSDGAPHILAQVNGTNAQTLRVYGTSSSSNANYERLTINSTGTDYLGVPTYTITPEAGGTGTQRNLTLGNTTCGINLRGYGVFLPDGGSFGSNFGYYQVAGGWAWRNHTPGFPGWTIAMTYNSNTISLRGGPYQSATDAATSIVYPWAIDVGNSYFGVWQSSPAYPLDVVGDVNTTTKYRIGGNIVLAGQASGYGTPTGGSHQTSFAAGSITLPNLAAAVAQLIVDLKAGNMPAA